MRELVQDLPAETDPSEKKSEKKSEKRSVKKSVKKTSHQRGDAPNRPKTKASYDGDSSSEAETFEDEEAVARYPGTQDTPQGRRVPGLIELTTRRPEYRALVSYRTYRLKDTSQALDEVETGKVNGNLKRLKHHFDYRFGGTPPLRVLEFLRTLKEALDINRISEGAVVLILPHLLDG
jgi:hypothetical protein